MSKFKVGDKVKVKNKFASDKYVLDVQKLANTYVTIREVVDVDYGEYYIEETKDLDCDDIWYEKDFKKEEYYIVSNEHTNGLVRTFWSPNSNGYTINLDEAGIYTKEDVNKKDYPLITKDNLNDRFLHDDYFIAVDDVELIGKKMTCILN